MQNEKWAAQTKMQQTWSQDPIWYQPAYPTWTISSGSTGGFNGNLR